MKLNDYFYDHKDYLCQITHFVATDNRRVYIVCEVVNADTLNLHTGGIGRSLHYMRGRQAFTKQTNPEYFLWKPTKIYKYI